MYASILNLSLLIFLVMFQFNAYAQPKAVMDTLEYDGGEVLPKESVSHDFVITNEGTEPLEIIDIHTTCGCTAAIPSATELVTGATSVISVNMNTGLVDTVLAKQVIIKTNDPKQQEIRLSIKAKVKNLVSFSPDSVFDFGNVSNNGNKEMTMYLNSVDGEDIKVLSYRSHFNLVSIEVGEKDENGIPVTLVLEANKFTSGQRLSSTFEIETNHPKQPLLQTRMRANVMGPIKFNPTSIFFGVIEPGQEVSKEITASLSEFAEVNDFEIEEMVISDNKILKGEVLGKDDKGQYKLKFDFTAPEKVGVHSGTVHIQSDIENQGVCILHFSGIVRAKS